MSSVQCGNCGNFHRSSEEVRECYSLPYYRTVPAVSESYEAPAPKADVPATEKQAEYLRKLTTQREHGWDDVDKVIAGLLTSKKATSAAIDLLVRAPKRQTVGYVELEDGIYRKSDGTILKVYHTVHGANQQVAKELQPIANEDGTFSADWEYVGKAGLRGLIASMRMTEEEARSFGQVYGFCVNCGRTLTREESLHVGYGPTCARNNGWWYPTKAELLALTADNPEGWTENDVEPPTCSLCDGVGHGYPGGGPCPLENRGRCDCGGQMAFDGSGCLCGGSV